MLRAISLFATLFCFDLPIVLSCFFGIPTEKPLYNVAPEQYNELPAASNSPDQNDGEGGTVSSCGHSQYWNSGEGAGIVNGQEVQPNEFPWVVNIATNTESSFSSCAGVIVNRRWILTAAHCVSGYLDDSSVYVVAGDHNRSQNTANDKYRRSVQIIIHPAFQTVLEFNYDFALVKLDDSLTFRKWSIQAVCLPESCSDSCQNDDMGFITGWGLLSHLGESQPKVLYKAKVPIVGPFQCALMQMGYVTISNQMICAGYESVRVDGCYGDSGSPLVIYKHGFFELCGITSFGIGCSREYQFWLGLISQNYYGVYARICTVREWIREITGT